MTHHVQLFSCEFYGILEILFCRTPPDDCVGALSHRLCDHIPSTVLSRHFEGQIP